VERWLVNSLVSLAARRSEILAASACRPLNHLLALALRTAIDPLLVSASISWDWNCRPPRLQLIATLAAAIDLEVALNAAV
jgi:hypothetical protein